MAAGASAAERFWRFSLAIYGRPAVAAALLALQDRRGIDINLALWCCWHAAEGRLLTGKEIAAAAEATRPWQGEVVQRLRILRRRLKAGVTGVAPDQVAAFRDSLKALELESERIAQACLAAVAAGRAAAGPPRALAEQNLQAYLAIRNVMPEPADRADLAALLDGVRDA